MISLAITTYNRSDLTVESFSKVYDHPLVDEIVICDDASESSIYNDLERATFRMDKVKLFVNPKNLGMSRNKHRAVCLCKNEWVVLLDSDNVLSIEYLDSIIELHPRTIYCPVEAAPNFSFKEFEGEHIDRINAKRFLDNKMFRVFLNCSNYLVNRKEYLKVYKHNPDIKEADTIWFNSLWLEADNNFYFTPGMVYTHRVHDGSGWLQNHKKNIEDANRLQKIIEGL